LKKTIRDLEVMVTLMERNALPATQRVWADPYMWWPFGTLCDNPPWAELVSGSFIKTGFGTAWEQFYKWQYYVRSSLECTRIYLHWFPNSLD